jgi:hypothetical protein
MVSTMSARRLVQGGELGADAVELLNGGIIEIEIEPSGKPIPISISIPRLAPPSRNLTRLQPCGAPMRRPQAI